MILVSERGRLAGLRAEDAMYGRGLGEVSLQRKDLLVVFEKSVAAEEVLRGEDASAVAEVDDLGPHAGLL